MKIVVKSGRTVHVIAKAAVKTPEGTFSRPVLKAHGPTSLVTVEDEDGEFLVARGYATKYEPPKAAEADKTAK